MKHTLTSNVSLNLGQLVVNQAFALLIFFVLSTRLDKAGFGNINLALSILLAAFNILSLGLDQLVVKKLAAGEDIKLNLSLYCFHVAISGGLFYALLALSYWLLPSSLYAPLAVLLFVGLGKLAMYWSAPFKQTAMGIERLGILAMVSVVSNVIRGLALGAFTLLHQIDLHTVITVFIAGDVCEFVVTVAVFCIHTKITPGFNWSVRQYLSMIKTALPQTGVVIVTSALARLDWIIIGATLSVIKLAEYSFAYKIYELSTLPLLALAPLLMTRFTKALKENSFNIYKVHTLIRMELMVAALTIVAINVCWQPLIGPLTSGKYGLINQRTIFILSLSIPFIYLNNIIWTIYFAQGRLKLILRSFLLAGGVNILLDIVLIPIFKNEGAALAVTVSLTAQFVFYLKHNNTLDSRAVIINLLLCTVCAVACIIFLRWVFADGLFSIVLSVPLFVLLLLLTRQLRFADRRQIGWLLQR